MVYAAKGVKRTLCAFAGMMVMPEYLFADDESLSFELAYTSDVWALASGGNDTGIKYLDNLYAGVGKSWAETGTSLYVSGLYNNGEPFSGDLVGDGQVISNIEAPVRATRAYEVWVEQQFGEAISVKAGLLDVNAEFDVLDNSGMFMSSAHGIGTDIGQTGENGPSIFPTTALGVRLQASLGEHLLIRSAVIDGVPGDPGNPRQTAIKLGDGDGAFIITELEYTTPRSKLLAGYWSYTADFETHAGGAQGGNDGFYVRGEGQLTGPDGENGLYAFARAGVAEADINAFSAFYSAGLRYQGVFVPERQDALGFAIAWAETSSAYKNVFVASPKREVSFELTYQVEINDWFSVQPDIQYIVNPLEGRNNALAFGLRTVFTFM